MKAAIILFLTISLQTSVSLQLTTDKWTSVVIDTSRQMWGEGNAAWVRSFGVDAFDANREQLLSNCLKRTVMHFINTSSNKKIK